MSFIPFKIEDLDLNAAESTTSEYSDQRAFDVLQKFLQPGGDVSTDAAAALIVNMQLDKAGQERSGTSWASFGSLVVGVSRQIPWDHPAQTKLVRLIQRLAQSTKANAVGGSEDGFVFYTSLEDFRSSLLEWHEPYFENIPDESDQFSRYINLSSFLARLTEAHFINSPSFAIWTMKYALEEEVQGDDVGACMIAAASMYILWSGQTIFVQVVQSPAESSPAATKSRSPGPLFTGPALGLERWRFWKSGFAAAAGETGAGEKGSGDQYRVLAGKAADFMDAIERNMTL